jgi:hypothetical protein
MSNNTQTFFASATVTVDAPLHEIWALWADVNAWNTWDSGIEYTKLHGNFKEGNTFTVARKGTEPVEATITSVTQGEEFSDAAEHSFGVIRNSHRMQSLGDVVKLTHEIEAEVPGNEAPDFRRSLWREIQRSLSESLNEVVDTVEEP